MLVEIINSIKQFDESETNWNKVYAADSHAQIFLSWSWLRGWLEVIPHDWYILAIRLKPDSPYVAFFPLAIRRLQLSNINIYRALQTCGHPVADYTGFLCLPEYEEDAIKLTALYIQQNLKWDVFHFKDVKDSRLNVFIEHFTQNQFQIRRDSSVTCPYISLPNEWEQYLQDYIGSKSRKNLRRSLRTIEQNSDFSMSNIQADNLENQIAVLLDLWQMKWGKESESVLNMYRTIFRHCAASNSLWIDILWDKTTPVAATAIYADNYKKVAYGYMTGFNREYSKFSPGRVMMAYGIKKAIDKQFKTFDLLRGDEEYKATLFGAKESFNHNFTIVRKNLRANTIRLAQYSKKLLSLSK